MNIVIGCLNSKYIHASLAPWCLKAGIDTYCKADINAVVIESTINSNPYEYVNNIAKLKPQIVCFSCYIWNIEKTLYVCKTLKNVTDCKIILGGPEVSYCPVDVLKNNGFIDMVLSGEGEQSLAKLLDIIYFNGDLCEADGLTYRKDEQIISNPEKEYYGTPVSPYTDEFFENLNGRICYIETSRGCPYRCAFCLSGRCSPLRFFDMEQVKENIIKLSNCGTKTVKFVDRTFNANADRANEILNFIISNYNKIIPKGVCFHFEIAGDILRDDTLNILSSAPKGLIQLEIGLQSFNEETLKAINRKTNTDKLKQNIKRLVSFNNMHIHIDLIAGLTGEDIISFENSFNSAYALAPHMLQLGFLKLLHGAKMRDNPNEYPCEYSKNPPYEVLSTPWLSECEIKKIKKCEDALERMYNSGRFLFTLEYLLNCCNFTPFRLFFDFGNSFDGEKLSLKEYALQIYNYFKAFSNEKILKEKIICDLLSCCSESQMPKELISYSPIYKKVKTFFVKKYNQPYKIAVLNESGYVYAVNQIDDKNLYCRVDGEFYPIDYFVLENNE